MGKKRLKLKKRADVITPLDDRLKGKKVVYLTGPVALSMLGIDWSPILPTSPLMVLGINAEPLGDFFGEDSFVDCTECFRKMGYFCEVEKVFCAKPVRAYVEWVYNCLEKGYFPEKPESFLFTDEEVEEVRRYLEKLCSYLRERGMEDKARSLEKWISEFRKSSGFQGSL